ncbi:hypothetical protein MKX03_032671 [Papaver bracteatum]|nr:hypothetical protein MKX03_032671 [Papaver bracteatum]
MKEIDASLRETTIEKNVEDISPTTGNVQKLTLPVNNDNCQVKGIKVKEKIVASTAIRPLNALEKLNQKKISRNVTSIPQNTTIEYHPILNGQSHLPMTLQMGMVWLYFLSYARSA